MYCAMATTQDLHRLAKLGHLKVLHSTLSGLPHSSPRFPRLLKFNPFGLQRLSITVQSPATRKGFNINNCKSRMSARTTKGVQFDLHALSRVLYRGPERFTIKFTINQADKGRLQSFGIFSLSIERAKLFTLVLSRNTI